MDETTTPQQGQRVTVRCLLLIGDQAELEVPGQDEPARWPAERIMADTGLQRSQLPGWLFTVTLTETQEHGRTFTGFQVA